MRKDIAQALTSTNAAFNVIVVSDDTWGGDEWGEEFKQKLIKAQQQLLDLKKEMGERRYFD